MVAMAITSVVALGGFKAYEYFMKETKKEAGKMDDLAEFNLLTKDFLKFSEGAGITTAYLNLPIKVKDCNDTEPCIRKFTGDLLVAADPNDIPSVVSSQKCVQFFKEGRGLIESKKAYPDKKYLDKTFYIKDMDVPPPATEIYATWILKDASSPPVLMMKMREGGVVLNYLRSSRFQVAKSTNTDNIQYSFFETTTPLPQIQALIGYPFLIYNTLYNNHYTIQYLEDVVSCATQSSQCQSMIASISKSAFPGDATMKTDTQTNYPTNVYALKFKEIDMTQPFFKDIKDTQNLPSECIATAWGEGIQSADQYWFPSHTYSVWQEPDASTDLGGPDQLNILHLSHYYSIRGWSLAGKGLMAAVPIDIIRYKVEDTAGGSKKSLVAELWHTPDIPKKTKISDLKGPFVLTRKIGSSELGLWYNPLKR